MIALVKASISSVGGGTLTLCGPNTYTGGTTIDAGPLSLAHGTGGIIDAAGTGRSPSMPARSNSRRPAPSQRVDARQRATATIGAATGTTATIGGTLPSAAARPCSAPRPTPAPSVRAHSVANAAVLEVAGAPCRPRTRPWKRDLTVATTTIRPRRHAGFQRQQRHHGQAARHRRNADQCGRRHHKIDGGAFGGVSPAAECYIDGIADPFRVSRYTGSTRWRAARLRWPARPHRTIERRHGGGNIRHLADRRRLLDKDPVGRRRSRARRGDTDSFPGLPHFWASSPMVESGAGSAAPSGLRVACSSPLGSQRLHPGDPRITDGTRWRSPTRQRHRPIGAASRLRGRWTFRGPMQRTSITTLSGGMAVALGLWIVTVSTGGSGRFRA